MTSGIRLIPFLCILGFVYTLNHVYSLRSTHHIIFNVRTSTIIKKKKIKIFSLVCPYKKCDDNINSYWKVESSQKKKKKKKKNRKMAFALLLESKKRCVQINRIQEGKGLQHLTHLGSWKHHSFFFFFFLNSAFLGMTTGLFRVFV